MMLDNLYQVIDDLSTDDLDALSEYIEQQREQRRLAQYTAEERIQKIEAAFAELREGLTPGELDEITEAMNSKTRIGSKPRNIGRRPPAPANR